MSPLSWYKGNIHTHTTESDGDSSPQHVAQWYRDHGYHFLVLSDHNHYTVLQDAEEHPSAWPVMIGGEELTSEIGPNLIPVHVNGIGISSDIEPYRGPSVEDALIENVRRVNAAGGLASINHPSQKWAFGGDLIKRAPDAWAMEVFNGNGDANSFGGGGVPSAESMWDHVLSAGNRIFAVATDDAHHFVRGHGPMYSNPGRGWIVVRAENGRRETMLEAMQRGDFYASTGPRIAEIRMSREEVVVEMDRVRNEKFVMSFYGEFGRELWRHDGDAGRYRPSRLDTYVRVTIRSSRGDLAWTQPLFLGE